MRMLRLRSSTQTCTMPGLALRSERRNQNYERANIAFHAVVERTTSHEPPLPTEFGTARGGLTDG